jgi:zinc protease
MRHQASLTIASLTVAVLTVLSGCTSKPVASGGSAASVASAPSGSGVTALRPYRETTLPNGLKILFLEDQTLPSIALSLLVKTGSAQDPEGQSGLSNLVTELLDQGNKKRDAMGIADDLARLGAQFDAAANYDYSTLSLTGLSFSANEVLVQFYDLATGPTFPNEEIERVKKQVIARLERGLDNPSYVADLATLRAVYPAHPYGRTLLGAKKDVSSLSKKSVIQHYLRYYRPNNAILSVVGKFDDAYARKVEATFSNWTHRDIPTSDIPVPVETAGVRLRVVDKPGLTQAQIRFAGLGIERKDESFLALRVANTILGGAFTSRLNDKVRKELGLTYGISSSFDPRLQRGPFEIETFTKVDSIKQVVDETLAIYRSFIEKGVTAEEVDRAKGYLRGVFPQAIQTSERLALNLMTLRLYGLPDRYLTHYIYDLDRLSVSEINRAIRKNMKPDQLSIVVHAPQAAVEAIKPQASSVEVLTVDQLR